MISVIIPTFQEEASIEKILYLLDKESAPHEVIVVDGGSLDATVEKASSLSKVILSKKGRGLQLNKGVQDAKGEILFFLHADSWIESGTLSEIEKAVDAGFIGGCLNHKVLNSSFVYRWIEWTGNFRARKRKIFYGDQGIFVRKEIFYELGGFKPLSLFEDVEFSRRLRSKGPTTVLSKPIYTSDRRWKKQGVIRTTLLNRLLLTFYSMGMSDAMLARWYRDIR